MRNLIYSMMVSLDGFVEGPGDSIDWLIVDEEIHSFINDQQAEIGEYLHGRQMYELMSAYWPTAEDNSDNPGFIRDFSRIFNVMPKYVFSGTLEKANWDYQLVREDAVKAIGELKQQPGKALGVGGARLAGSCVKAGLVDIFELFVNPVVVGSGTPFLPPAASMMNLTLVEMNRFKSGVVRLRYLKSGS